MADFTIRQRELLRPISAVLTDPAAPSETLEGKTVHFRMRFAGEDTYTVDAEARIVDAEAREVAYDWVAGDTDRPGLYEYRWVVVNGGEEQSFPTREQTLEIVGFNVAADGLPFATAYEAKRYVSEAKAADALKVQLVLEDAAGMVADHSVAPSPISVDYARKAKRAELRIFEWLWVTKGFVSGTRVAGEGMSVGDTYKTDPKTLEMVLGIVAATMGDYAKDAVEASDTSGAASVHNVTPEPLW